jgi:proteasome lid subunit RPN8/RPN11
MLQKILIKRLAYENMMNFAKENIKTEVIGLLFGNFLKDTIESCIVESTVPMRTGSHIYAEFMDSDYEIMGLEIKKHAKINQSLIGWFHSHPFGGTQSLYMSSTDKLFHANAMRIYPDWLALVLDPFRINDKKTYRGIKGFIITLEKKFWGISKKVIEMPIEYID